MNQTDILYWQSFMSGIWYIRGKFFLESSFMLLFSQSSHLLGYG